ncbi:MAG: lipopolysaccharide heptosyltransferase II [Candidatus Omnitrophica bacterium]|nr:lipopolysaccharide heptosyltransferase II [Candidatus Omnitrophota bacterium]
MNILQILPELNVGGVETGTVDLAGYLVSHGHKSVVVSNGGGLVAGLQSQGSKHYTLPVHAKNPITAFRCIGKLASIIQKEKIDIVHARSRVPAWIAFFACRRTEAHFMTTCHGYYTPHFFSRVMGWGKTVIAISDAVGRHMVHDFKTPAENIRVIPRSVDLEKFSVPRAPKSDKKSFTVVMVARITPLKGHSYFLKAMARVIRRMPSVRVRIIGEAPPKKQAYKDELVLLTRRLGISEQVEFMGNRRDIPQLLSEADCLVLSTVTQEAFGRVIIEAQAAGVPVVATSVGGTTEIIEHEKTGLLVLPKDVEAMAAAVWRVLNDPDLAAGMVLEAKKKIESRYTLERMAEATLSVYKELMQATKILVIKMTAVGDVVLSTAAIRSIRRKFPQGRIYCLTSSQAGPVVESLPYVDETLLFDGRGRNVKALWRTAAELREFNFDKVIDLQNNRTSHLLSFLALPKESYGYNNGKFSFLLSKKIKNNVRNIPPVEHQFRILAMLGIDYTPDLRLELHPSSKDDAFVQEILDSEWLSSPQVFVGLNVSASVSWPTKNWPLEHMAKLCDILGSKNVRVVLTGENKDRPLGRQLIARARAKPASFIGKTSIMQLAALIKRCRVYISPDSAPLHVAAGMGVPIIAFFGPTDSRRHMPPSDKSIVLHRPLKCSPCYSNVCRIRTHACMTEIMPEEVARKVMSFIK